MRPLVTILMLFFVSLACAQTTAPDRWKQVVDSARGETVYFNAWGGDERINQYIQWAGEQVGDQFGVTVKHVKVTDTGNVVARVLAEKSAGQHTGGSVDLVWINGENFAAMKREQLLFGPWSEDLPNYQWVDTRGKPTVLADFTIPVAGLEAPWGMAQLVFIHDSATLAAPPKSMPQLLNWAQDNPGRFTYPLPPDYIGSTFLKQALAELVVDSTPLQRPVDAATFDTISKPLWAFLDALAPFQWRRGKAFPPNGQAQKTLLADGEVDIAMTFSPSDASSAMLNGQLPDSVRTYVHDGGTIGNTHFVAIPFNANARAGAQVLANFLLSPHAQARKQDPRFWGDPTVLNVAALGAADKARFDQLDLGVATLTPEQLGTTLPEPHPSWMERIEKNWTERYGSGD